MSHNPVWGGGGVSVTVLGLLQSYGLEKVKGGQERFT